MKKGIIFAAIALMVFLISCGPKVMVPPRISLSEYQIIGLVEFTSNTEGSLETYATQRFMEEMTKDQEA